LSAAREGGDLPYDVRAFRGSHLALMLSLEGVAGGAERVPLLVHLPGYNDDTVKEIPSFELYEAGKRYRKALDTLVRDAAASHVPPARLPAPGLTLEEADAWLASLVDDDGSGLGPQLRTIDPAAILDDLLGDGQLAARLSDPADAEAVWARLAA